MDRFAIVCNYRAARNTARAGAKAWLGPWWTGGEIERVQVTVKSRGGRWVSQWERLDRLENFRIKTVVGEHHPRDAFIYDAREAAERDLAHWRARHEKMIDKSPRELHDPGDEDRRPA